MASTGFPARIQSEALARHGAGNRSAPLTSTILIVDDQEVGRDALEGLLFGQGYELIFASNGFEALDKAAAHVPDLVLLDVMMPEMDGFEVCRRLRDDPVLAEMPVVMVTALDDQESRLHGLEAGADDFITKPYNRTELRTRVKTIVRLNRYRRILSERLRFARVVEHASEGYLLVDQTDAILYGNSRARQFLGGSEDAALESADGFLSLARRQFQLEPERAWEDWPVTSPDALTRTRYLVRPETSSAQAFWLQVEILDAGNEGEMLLCLRDITAQVNQQRDIRRFHHVISHKLNTPLYAIIGGLGLLVDDAFTMPREEIAEMANIAMSGAKRLQDAVNDVLRYLNPPKAASPGGGCLLGELPAQVGELCGQQEIKCTCTLDAEVEQARLTLTPDAMSIILGELLENARKFHPQHTPQVEITARQAASGYILLAVGDDGQGLSPEQLEHVWELYYQGEKRFTGEVPGMGLGLPLVASLVWGVGGECHLVNHESSPGVVVELLLPLTEE